MAVNNPGVTSVTATAPVTSSGGTAPNIALTTSGANSVVLRDANQNIAANAFDDAYTNTAASGTQITLTVSSPRRYTITGSGGQVIKLPDATTLASGAVFQFDNNQSSGAITVNNNSNTLVVSVPSGGFVLVNLLSNATAAGSWDRHDQAPSNVSWSTNTLDYAGSITSATWNGTAVAINRGGTGASTKATAFNALSPMSAAGDIIYGGTSGAGTALAIGTAGQVLTVNSGATAPQWTTPTTGTVTSVGGTGTVNGITLTGTVTTTGNLTLGGTLDLSSPPAIGGTTASTGRFTTVTSTVATGTAPFTVASTTAVANLSIGGNAGTVTNGVYTTDTGTVTNTMLAGSIANAKLTNSSITFGSTAQALGSTVSAISGVTIDNGAIGGTTPAAGTFTTLIGGGGSANYEQITGGATGKAVQFQSLGTDTNISLAIQSKGTGAIDLAAGSSGVNISNGGTVTAITRTAAGSGYTSQPTVAITAPTTAGGVQATATVTIVLAAVSSIAVGGTGYTAGDVLTISGGTSAQTAQLTVSTVSAGVITAVTVTRGGDYTVAPTNPASVTGGTGTGATFNLTFGILVFTITNAGSGYVEQPTVSFSGGGGSGAAAYATVGGTSVFRGLGATTNFSNPAGNVLTLLNPQSGTSSVSAVTIANGGTAQIYPSATGGDLSVSSNGTGNIRFQSAVNSYEQLRVSNTTSAVNYVQVTGSATGNNAVISAQGSDASIGLSFVTKGGFGMQFNNASGGSIVQYTQSGTTSATTNFLRFTNFNGSTGTPLLSTQGGDADISLGLFPKGLGIVLMNQQTPTAVTATGTLTIANLLTQIITSTSATAVSLTLPTGTLSDAGVSGGTSAVNTSFNWSIINTGSAVGDVTLVAGTAHTIVGSVTVAVGTTGSFRSRKTATNTFVTYRV